MGSTWKDSRFSISAQALGSNLFAIHDLGIFFDLKRPARRIRYYSIDAAALRKGWGSSLNFDFTPLPADENRQYLLAKTLTESRSRFRTSDGTTENAEGD
jgi:hypothetical protein